MTSERVLHFEDADISVWGDAVDLAGPDADPETLVVLFHYTGPVPFANIVDDNREAAELWASLQEENALFGPGVYASERPPDVFRERRNILLNNYLTQIEADHTILEKWSERAAYCIPLIVDRNVAFNVAKQATPQMPAVTGPPAGSVGSIAMIQL